MAAVADPKIALLSEELKDFALSQPTSIFPKAGNGNFFCAICSELAFNAWKLLCCNKTICSSCHDKLEFPTTCPLCDHTPLEADLCTVNKALRNTMRAWLQKHKKKEDAKSTSRAVTPPAPATPIATDAPFSNDVVDKVVESIEGGIKAEDTTNKEGTADGELAVDAEARATSTLPQGDFAPVPTPETETQQDVVAESQDQGKSAEESGAVSDPNADQDQANGSNAMLGNNAIFNMNGMPGQMGFGFPNQGNFNGMGFNGMNVMPGMMGNGNWNSMNPMDFQNMHMPGMANGMYDGFGGNMGMNDMSMMNYGGGYGNNRWQGGVNGAGYGNFNGYNPMGGYNQSGPQYPQMMNQFPKNNFQNQNRFPPNGAAFPQSNRKGSHGGLGNQSGPGFQQKAHSRPGSRNGPNNRDGGSPAGSADAAPKATVEGDAAEVSTEPAQEGKVDAEGVTGSVPTQEVPTDGDAKDPDDLTRTADDGANGPQQENGLNAIQTFESVDVDQSAYHGPMMNDMMQPDQAFAQGMMNNYGPSADMIGSYDGGMGFHHNNYGQPRGYSTAYGAATVLTGEPRGLGVEGAPTGPRAMREGRPNTGFSSRAISARFGSHAPTPSVSSAQEAAPATPLRQDRASPERDETLRTKERSPSRSHSQPRARDVEQSDHRERERSADRESKHHHRDRSPTPTNDEYNNNHKERRHHRSSRYDDVVRDEDYDDRHRDRSDRGDRTRSTSRDSKHRSRREKEKHRSSRSHRDRSRDHKRRHRSRSHSPVVEERRDDNDVYANGAEEPSSRRKDKSEKKHRDRDRSRDRDRRDRRDRDYDYEKEKDRSREKDKERDRKRSRRDRDDDEDDYRSSRRSRKDRDRDRERDRDYDHEKSRDREPKRVASPPRNAPTGPSADNFSIRGISKQKRAEAASPVQTKTMPPPPTGPRALQPPTGPAADRDRERRDSRGHARKGSVSSVAGAETPKEDHYAAEREKNTKERVDRDNRDKVLQSIHGRATGRANSISNPSPSSSHRPSLSSKRSRDEVDRDECMDREDTTRIPTGPSAHRDKRRRSAAGEGDNKIMSLFTAGMRKAGRKERERERRGGVKDEGDVERELERVERERERRW